MQYHNSSNTYGIGVMPVSGHSYHSHKSALKWIHWSARPNLIQASQMA